MNSHELNLLRLQTLAVALQELLPRLVFTGGAVLSFYINRLQSVTVRPTTDVDSVIAAINRKKYYEIDLRLRHLGFVNDLRPGAPLCRYLYRDIILDLMPTTQSILGFSNRWYHDGMGQAQSVLLPNAKVISLFTLPYYIATKCEAFLSRGKGDFRLSRDIEDIITVLDGNIDAETILQAAPVAVKIYLQKHFLNFSHRDDFQDAVMGNLIHEQDSTSRIRRVMRIVKAGHLS